MRVTPGIQYPDVYIQCQEHAEHWVIDLMNALTDREMSVTAVVLERSEEPPRVDETRQNAKVHVYVMTNRDDVGRFMDYSSREKVGQGIVVFSPRSELTELILPPFYERYQDYFSSTCSEMAILCQNLMSSAQC